MLFPETYLKKSDDKTINRKKKKNYPQEREW